MNLPDVRSTSTQASFRGPQLAAEHATHSSPRAGSHTLPAYTPAQVAAMARARLDDPGARRPPLGMTTAVIITALVGLVVLGLGLMTSGAFLASRAIGLGLMVLGIAHLSLIFRARQIVATTAMAASGKAMLCDAGLCGACAATLRPGARACEICGTQTPARDVSRQPATGAHRGDSRDDFARTDRAAPPLATSTAEFLRPSIWIYDGLERAVPAAARLPFLPTSDPDSAKRWAEARATLEQGAAGRFPRAVAFFVVAALLIVIAALTLANHASDASIVLAFAAAYLLTRGWIQLSSGRISASRIREEFLSRRLCPCCASDLNVVGEPVSSGREATLCTVCNCMWYPLHGELRYFARRITSCRWCGYGVTGLAIDGQGFIRCPECGRRGVGPLHVECGNCGAIVPITQDQSESGLMNCANCEARNQFKRIGPQAIDPNRVEGVYDGTKSV